MLDMAKRKGQPKSTGRDRFKYVGLPIPLYEELKEFADRDDRTIASIAKRAVREYLDRHAPEPDPE